MKKFIKQSILFILLIIVFIEAVSAALLFTNLYLFNYPGRDVYMSIEKSLKKNKTKILLLGDSVGRQLFSNENENDSINSLACNQSIGVPGQYFLLSNYLNAGNNIDKLIIIYHPESFRNNLDQNFTYHYFLKPFYNSDYSDLFTPEVKAQIKKIPYYQFSQLPHIKVTSWAPKYNSTGKDTSSFLSSISLEYLAKINKLSKKHNFEVILLPPPISLKKKDEIENMRTDEIKEPSLQKVFKDYLAKVSYIDSTNFIDGIHLTYPEKYTDRLIKEIMK